MNTRTLVVAFSICPLIAGGDLTAAEFLILGLGRAYGVSGDGSVIVGTDFETDQASQAWCWTREEGVTALEPVVGEESGFAYAVSGDGSIVGGSPGSVATRFGGSFASVATIWTSDNDAPMALLDTESRSTIWSV